MTWSYRISTNILKQRLRYYKNTAMQIEKGYIYHIYNQGNNKQKIFFNTDNYLFFLRKIKTHILPYGDIMAWCLMPNHFHLMVLVNKLEVVVTSDTSIARTSLGAKPSLKTRTINQSIGLMLRSYTNAVNKQQNRTGSLFRKNTKAECVNCPNRITPSFIKESGITKIKIIEPEAHYPQICFDYIHQNPVKANLVKKATDWQFSSAKDYVGLRGGKLINKERAKEYVVYLTG